jgi:hypothetical protein
MVTMNTLSDSLSQLNLDDKKIADIKYHKFIEQIKAGKSI